MMRKMIISLISAVFMLLSPAIPAFAQDADQPAAFEAEPETAAAAEPEPELEPESAVIEPEPEVEIEAAAMAEPESEPEPVIEPIIESVIEPVVELEVAAVEPESVSVEGSQFVFGSMRFGVRFAYNNSSARNMEVRYQEYDTNLFEMMDVEYYSHNSGSGHGFEIEAVVICGLTNRLAVNISPGFAFRNPFVSNVAKAREWALVVPALLEFYIFETQFHLLGGIQLDIPFGSKMNWDNDGLSYNKSNDFNRSSADFGIVLGFNLYLRENYFIDFRYNIGLTHFVDHDKNKDSRMNQLSVGAGTIFKSR